MLVSSCTHNVNMLLLFAVLIQVFVSSYGHREDIEGRIVNGITATNFIPYQVSLRVSIRDNLRFGRGHACGGVLVKSRTVLTAAHCLMDGDFVYRTPFDIHVVFGSLNRFMFTQESVIGYVDRVIIHPEYRRRESLAHDIGMMILRRPVEFNEIIHPIDLIDYQIAAGEKCEISGWGDIVWGGPRARELQKGNVTIFDRDVCNSTTSYNGAITNGMVCASGRTEAGAVIDTCQGDSGGPLVCNNLLVGLTSFGFRCGAIPERPGVYVDVYYYRNWIMDHWNSGGIQKSHKIVIFMFTLFVNLIWKLKL